MKRFNVDSDLKEKVIPGLIISGFTVCLVFLILNLGVFYDFIGMLLATLKYLFYGIAIAYILNQPMKLIENLITKYCSKSKFMQKKKRTLAILGTLIFVFLLLLVVVSIVVPNFISSAMSLFSNTSSFIKSVFKNIDEIFIYFKVDFRMEDIGSVENLINMPWQDMLKQGVDILSRSAGGIMANASSFLAQFGVVFTGFIFSLYLLGNKETFLRQLRKVAGAIFGYSLTKVIFKYSHKANVVFSNFISGQLVEACILWVLYYLTMNLFNFPYPELIATIISLFSLVPFFGPICSMFLGAVLILSHDFMQAIYFMVYFQILSQFEDNFIYPRVVGSSVGLPGIWVILSILVFGDLFGILGMIIAVPSGACLYALASEIVNYVLKQRKLKITEDVLEEVD